jgi:hypothetical protein
MKEQQISHPVRRWNQTATPRYGDVWNPEGVGEPPTEEPLAPHAAHIAHRLTTENGQQRVSEHLRNLKAKAHSPSRSASEVSDVKLAARRQALNYVAGVKAHRVREVE